MPVTKQPQQHQWFTPRATGEQTRPGLEILNGMRQVHLKQKIDMLEVITGWSVKNKFRITDPDSGHIMGLFKEESDTCERQCCKNARGFTANIMGENNVVIFKIERPLACACSCCPRANDGCCGQSLTVLDNQNNKISEIQQIQSCHLICCNNLFGLTITDSQGNVKYTLQNTYCQAQCCEKCSDGCCTDKYLHLVDTTGNSVGLVTKKWRGCATECCTPADSILIDFPETANSEDKASIISAVLLADYNLWERENDN